MTDVSGRVAGLASSTFYSGHLNTGGRLMTAALALLDLAVSLAPGIGWGRDVYEAVTGKDLFSDEPLDSLGRTAAVIGMVSAGLGVVDPLKDVNGRMKGVTVYREHRALDDIADSGERRFIRIFDEKLP